MPFTLLVVLTSALSGWGCAHPVGSARDPRNGVMPIGSPSPIADASPSRALRAEQIEKTWSIRFTFETKSISEKHDGIRSYEISADYPLMKDDQAPSTKRFNKWISRKIGGYVAQFRRLEQSAETQDKRRHLPPIHITEGLDISYDVYYCDDRFLSMRLTHSVMQLGQMHPIAYYETINYDFTRARELKPSDVFRPGFLNVFSQYSREEVRRKYVFQPGTDNWMKQGTMPRAANFNNWNIVPEGVLISFEDYQIAAHSFGQAELIIPFSALTRVLRPHSPSRAFIQTAELSLPGKIMLALDRRFPGWKYSEVNEEVRRFLKEEVSPFARPDIISGDFNGDDKVDYAVLIEQTSSGRKLTDAAIPKFYLVVFLKQRRDFKMHVLDPEGEYLTLIRRGARDYNYQKQSHFTYQNDAIFTGIFEKAGTSYIYRNGRFRTIITSD